MFVWIHYMVTEVFEIRQKYCVFCTRTCENDETLTIYIASFITVSFPTTSFIMTSFTTQKSKFKIQQ